MMHLGNGDMENSTGYLTTLWWHSQPLWWQRLRR